MATAFAPTRFEEGRPMLIAGLSRRYRFDERGEIQKQWERFAPYIGTAPDQIGAAAFGAVSFRADGFDYLTGVHVWDGGDLPKGFSLLRIPPRRYAVFAHDGPVSALAATMQKIMHEWLPASGHALAGAPQATEVYGENFNVTSGIGDTEVWIAVESVERRA